MSAEELFDAWLHAAQYYDTDYPLPVTGRQVTLGQVVTFAVMASPETVWSAPAT